MQRQRQRPKGRFFELQLDFQNFETGLADVPPDAIKGPSLLLILLTQTQMLELWQPKLVLCFGSLSV